MALVAQKELEFLDELISAEMLAATKFTTYSQMCTDPQLKQYLQQAAQAHQRHYSALMKHVDPRAAH